jgi:subtilisin family serine protease
VLAVAATNQSNHRADFSNWGPYVDIAAPGEAVWSAIARNYEYDEFSQIFFEVLWGWDTVNPYMSNDGTSFSSPVAAGACALIRSQYPWMTPRQVMQQIVLRGDVVAYDNPIGPRLNLLNAVNAAAVGAPRVAAGAGAAMAPPFPNPARDGCSVSFALPAAGPVRIEAMDLAGRRVRTLLDGPLAEGAHEIRWDGTAAGGRRVAPGLYFLRLTCEGETLFRRVTVLP